MISIADYFAGYTGHQDITAEHRANAAILLAKVNPLLEWAQEQGWKPTQGTHTRTMVSGQRDGGWRPKSCPIGAPGSAHKQGRAVDVADADGSLDELLTDDVLEDFGLYREMPTSTLGWAHLTDRAPPSNHRSFYP